MRSQFSKIKIPTNYEDGQYTEYQNKAIIWIMPGVCFGIALLIFPLLLCPWVYNYHQYNITRDNYYYIYQYGKTILHVVNLFDVILYFGIELLQQEEYQQKVEVLIA
ncbi:hypothetical protein PPERSA_12639 [Pseudocohnilembus persalinus]|uniref:Uncharacterized protein n=1 Tax=Pseudocohnilembus persalinus TaxID=266149 RepID=A0A0V0QCX1_PSEPJ|nr:hypothetical protein PPERSA_12639 [Pseudocohnilembus persalinus]|eukprot:KRW99963.1 hypothetical protein PPERSA_12639 [Pseudocohnilembus persalinus]